MAIYSTRVIAQGLDLKAKTRGSFQAVWRPQTLVAAGLNQRLGKEGVVMRAKSMVPSILSLCFVAATMVAISGEAQAAPKTRSEAEWNRLARNRYTMRRVRLQRSSTTSTPLTVVKASDDQPDGFGKEIDLSELRDKKEVLVSAFINTADSLGVKIRGLQPGDTISIDSTRGLASFAGRDKIKKALSSLAGVVAVGVGSKKPESAAFMKEVQKFADSLIELVPSRGKKRDAFGKEPGSGYKRKEGGVLLCMPLSGGAYYAGEIKRGGKRYDEKRPSYVKDAFFPIRVNVSSSKDRKHNRRIVQKDGSLIILAWDSNFEDNQGVYEVDVRVNFGTGESDDDVQPTSLKKKKKRESRAGRGRGKRGRASTASAKRGRGSAASAKRGRGSSRTKRTDNRSK